MIDLEHLENSLPGYKYLVGFTIEAIPTIFTTMPTCQDRICICDTRDECIEQIKKHIDMNKEAYSKENIECEPYNVLRDGAYIKWKDKANGNEWMWEYGIYPVKYESKEHSEEKCDIAAKKTIDQFYDTNFDPCFDYYGYYEKTKKELNDE